MNQKVVDGILITRPTQEDVLNLKVGDAAPTVFGGMGKVKSIYALKQDWKGKWFVLYYVEWGDHGGTISGDMKEGEVVATIPATGKWMRTENYPKWSGYETVDVVVQKSAPPRPKDIFHPTEAEEYALALHQGHKRFGSECKHDTVRDGRCVKCLRRVVTRPRLTR